MLYQNEILNYFPSLSKSPIYIDNTNTLLFLQNIHLNSIIHFIKNMFLNISQFNIYYFNKILTYLNSPSLPYYNLNFYHNFNQIFYIIIFLAFINLIIYNKYLIYPIKNKINELEQKIKYLNKKDNLLENEVERFLLMNKNSQEDIEKKIKYYEKELKKFKKEINKYN